jgi:hypothetical protein
MAPGTPVLSAAELASLRADVAASLPDTCAIHGFETVEDERGGDEEQPATVKATGVRCLLAPTRVGITGTESGGLYGPMAAKGYTLDTTASVWLGTFPSGRPWPSPTRSSWRPGRRPGSGSR